MSTDLNVNKRSIISIAPGRTCLFGDHQDYLGLPVIACAINRYVNIKANENNTNLLVLKMVDINQERIIDINQIFTKLKPRDYFASSLKVLRKYNCIPNLGYDIYISGNIPINSGTSSSTALLMAWINFLIKAFGISHEVTPEFISRITYEAEVLEHGEPGGIMDHYSIGIGKIIFINTVSPYDYTILGTELSGLITGVSGVPKETISMLVNLKKLSLLAIKKVQLLHPHFNLHETQINDLDRYLTSLSPNLIPYFKAAILNHQITLEAMAEFKKSKIDKMRLGSLMNLHHEVLRDLLKITVPIIDDMINAALEAGAYGAKIVGSGGGGSIVAITESGKEQFVINAILNAGAKEAYSVSVDTGARIVSS